VWIGDADVYSRGKPHPENETRGALAPLEQHEVILGVDLAAGSGERRSLDVRLQRGLRAHQRGLSVLISGSAVLSVARGLPART
jgi:hypothetical protein